MKRWVLALLLATLAVFVMAGSEKYEEKFSLTITGVASGDDSTVIDTIWLPFNAKHRFNRVIGRVYWDSVQKHEPATSFLECSVMTVFKTVYGGLHTTLDSTKSAMVDAGTQTHTIIEGGLRDSLYGEKFYVILRVADTVGVTTDTTTTIQGRIELLHAFD